MPTLVSGTSVKYWSLYSSPSALAVVAEEAEVEALQGDIQFELDTVKTKRLRR